MVYCSTKSVLWCSKMCKIVFGRGSAPNPVGGAYDSPPNLLVGWGGGYPLPIPYPPRRLWRLVLGAFGASSSESPPLLHIATLTTDCVPLFSQRHLRFPLSEIYCTYHRGHWLSAYGRRAFAIADRVRPSAWNSLSDPVRNMNTTEAASGACSHPAHIGRSIDCAQY